MPRSKKSKADRIRSLLSRPEGASLEAICRTTGWQRHSVHAALSALRKAGAMIERRPAETAGGPATYHLVVEPEVEA